MSCAVCDVSVLMADLASISRQLQEVAPQGGGLIAATILFLSLAWSGIDPQGAEAVFDIPYQVCCVVALSQQVEIFPPSRGEMLFTAFGCWGGKTLPEGETMYGC